MLFLGPQIQKVHIADSETLRWKLTNSGFFTTAFAKTSLQPLYSKKDWAPFVWHGKHIPKHAMALWIALLGKHKTKDQLLKRNIKVDKKCVLCESEDELNSHLFLSCDFSSPMRFFPLS